MLYRERETSCPYFPGIEATYIESSLKVLKNDVSEASTYGLLLEKGFRRSGQTVYITECSTCNQCTPIRVPVQEFVASKSQRRVERLNSDVEVTIVTDPASFVTDEKALLYREYDYYHNKDVSPKLSLETARHVLSYSNSGYEGVVNMEYRLNGNLIGVGIIDIAKDLQGNINSLSSNYFYYDVSEEVLKRSIGVFSVLKEIDFCKKLGVKNYYLGLYLPECKKMNYKTNYKPYELLYYDKWFKEPESQDMVLNPQYLMKFPKPGSFDEQYKEICAVTYDLPLQYLYSAYMQGVFPWFDEAKGHPVLWQSPELRFVIFPEDFHVSKSIDKFLKKNPYEITVDTCFSTVMEECGKMKREGQDGTWIGPKMLAAYTKFAELGYAHSVEVWQTVDGNKELVGGFYGVLIGSVFFGESMFTKANNSSKVAFVIFARKFFECGGKMIDCQVYTENMARYNAKEIKREEFLELEKQYLTQPLTLDVWGCFQNNQN